jgi:hypothetical protein
MKLLVFKSEFLLILTYPSKFDVVSDLLGSVSRHENTLEEEVNRLDLYMLIFFKISSLFF